jgi:hypothetical protein
MSLSGIYPIVGLDARYEEISALPLFTVNKVSIDNQGGFWKYVRASGDLNKNNAAAITCAATPLAIPLTITALTASPFTTTSPISIGITQIGIPDTYYGWIWCGGPGVGGVGSGIKCRLGTDCAQYMPLYAHATAGKLDDAVVTNAQISGLFATETITTAQDTELFACTILTCKCQDPT